MNTIYLDETDDPVNICYDNVFKAVFTRGTPESQSALSGLVSTITGRTIKDGVCETNAKRLSANSYGKRYALATQSPPTSRRYTTSVTARYVLTSPARP